MRKLDHILINFVITTEFELPMLSHSDVIVVPLMKILFLMPQVLI
jgi:hypothetical protein